MKAEQRKELETNILADKMGQVVQRVKTSPRRTVTLYLVITAIVLVGIVVAYRWYRTGVQDAAIQWINLDDGSYVILRSLAQSEGSTPAGKAARFQLAWLGYWEGIKHLGMDSTGSLKEIAAAGQEYRRLRDECKDDPVFEPQAMLGMAVCEEAQAVQDRAHLREAVSLYDKLAADEKYKDTAEGKFAQSRLDQLRDKDGKVRAEANNTYEELQRVLGVRDLQVPNDLFRPQEPPPFNIDDILKKKDK